MYEQDPKHMIADPMAEILKDMGIKPRKKQIDQEFDEHHVDPKKLIEENDDLKREINNLERELDSLQQEL
jgi:ABC-type phosphate transport system auxiliary subunit